MPNQSAISVTGVGPRFAFTFNGTGGSGVGITCDNVVGTGVSITMIADGKWTVNHNLGKTGYVGTFTVEDNAAAGAGDHLTARIYSRSGNTCDIWVEDDGGALTNPDFVHGVIYV